MSSRQPKSRNKGTGIGRWMMLLGILFILGALGLTGYNFWDGYRADQASQRVEEQLHATIGEPVDDAEPDPDEEMPTTEIDGYRYIGELYVPDLDLTLPIMEEWDYSRLKIAPCRYSGSLYRGDLVIAGHNYSRHFSRLRYLDFGTRMTFTDVAGHVFEYEISDIEVMRPTQVDEMIVNDGTWDLTLFTCTVGGRTRHTIRCKRILQETDAQS